MLEGEAPPSACLLLSGDVGLASTESSYRFMPLERDEKNPGPGGPVTADGLPIPRIQCMKTRASVVCIVRRGLAILACLLTFHCRSAYSQDSAGGWFAFGGGGGVATSANVEISSTLGQCVLGSSKERDVVLESGFWAGLETQQSLAPTISIARTSEGHLTVTWSSASNRWTLEGTDNLEQPVWLSHETQGERFDLAPLNKQHFFRLKKL